MGLRDVFEWINFVNPDIYLVLNHELEELSDVLLKFLASGDVAEQHRP